MARRHKSKARNHTALQKRAANPFGFYGTKPLVIAGVIALAGIIYFMSRSPATPVSSKSRFYGLKGDSYGPDKIPTFEGRYVVNYDNGDALVVYESGKFMLDTSAQATPAGESARIFQPFASGTHRFSDKGSDVTAITRTVAGKPDFGLLSVPISQPADNKQASILSRIADAAGTAASESAITLDRAKSILGGKDTEWSVAKV
jgi:hypothetical protein